MKLIKILIIFIIFLMCTQSSQNRSIKVKPGIEVLIQQNFAPLAHKKVGLITNPTGITSDFRSTIDVLHNAAQVELVALFGPEHGVRGDIEGGSKVPQYIDPKTGVTVFSLYGKTLKPTPEMLENIDVLVYDIQDIGSRAYTFIYTMAYAMQAAEEAGIPFIVLDRPNPLGGNLVAGNVLDPRFSSFVGLYPIPYIYGMTVGELSKLFNEEFDIHCDLTVIPMEGWRREMLFEDTGLPWVPTSPHVPHAETSFFVAATGCIGELGTVSEGVGYTFPFEVIGAPWLDGEKLATNLNSRKLPGVHFRPLYYIPYYSKFAQQQCSGVQIHITNKKLFDPATVQIHILTALYQERDIFKDARISSFDRAFGTDKIRLQIIQGYSAEKIVSFWENELNRFLKLRTKYLIY